MKKLLSLLFLAIFVFLAPSAQAVYFGSADDLTLPKEKKINESAFVAGDNLVVDANIEGDLFCAGQNVTINGNVKGDVICVAQLIKINGIVDGNVRVAAQNIEINGIVNRNVSVISQSLTLAKASTVKGDTLFGVQNVDLRGSLGRDLAGAAERVDISGSLVRNAVVTATRISVIDPAKINGDFDYYTDNQGTASVNPSNVKGSINRHEIVRQEINKEQVKEASKAAMVMGKIFWMISSLVLGFSFLYLFGSSVEKRASVISKNPFITGLIGFAFLLLTPIAFVLLLITFIGAPLAFVLLLAYILAICLASIIPTIMVGQWVLRQVFKKKHEGYSWALVVGTVTVGLIFLVPVVGPITGFTLLLLGLGATFQSYLPSK